MAPLSFLPLSDRNEVQWEFVHGLFNQAVYGGRIDNPVDSDVIVSYLQQYFSNTFFSGSGKGPKLKFGPGLSLPSSSEYRVSAVRACPSRAPVGTSCFSLLCPTRTTTT